MNPPLVRETLAALSATFNLASFFLVLLGVHAIRAGRRDDHRRRMTAALVASALFLACYLARQAWFGHYRFGGTGSIRTLYLVVLGTHTPLAAAIVPLVLWAFWLARKERFDAHRRLARITFPLWAYVSITGVAVFVLQRAFPSAG